MVQPVFYGQVLAGGLLVLDRPKDYAKYVRSFAGKHVEILCRRRRTKRSSQANRYYWGVVIATIAEHCGYEPEEMHEALAMKFLRIEDDPITKTPRRKRTPETDSTDFADYIERCKRFAATDLGVYVPDANEVAA